MRFEDFIAKPKSLSASTLPRNKSLAKKIPIFIDFFEKKVHEIQQSVDQLRDLEALYLIARETLVEFENDKNDFKIQADSNTICISTSFHQTQHWKDFLPIVERITKELAARNLREDSVPTHQNGWYTVWTWNCKRGKTLQTLRLSVELPFGGNDKCRVTSSPQLTTTHVYDFIWTED